MKAICPELQDNDLKEFINGLSVKTIKPKEYIFDLDIIQKEIAFVVSGLVRSYYIDSKGFEKTSWFVKEYEYVTDYPAFLNGSKTNYIFEAIEPTTIVILPKITMDEAYKSSQKFERYGRIMSEEILKYLQYRIENLLFKSATERYKDFIDNEKDLLKRVSVGHIASYLGIERQSLTRIRKALVSK